MGRYDANSWRQGKRSFHSQSALWFGPDEPEGRSFR
jgi:hypothetical protein